MQSTSHLTPKQNPLPMTHLPHISKCIDRVLHTLAYKLDESGALTTTLVNLARDAQVSRRSVIRAFALFRAKGYISYGISIDGNYTHVVRPDLHKLLKEFVTKHAA